MGMQHRNLVDNLKSAAVLDPSSSSFSSTSSEFSNPLPVLSLSSGTTTLSVSLLPTAVLSSVAILEQWKNPLNIMDRLARNKLQ